MSDAERIYDAFLAVVRKDAFGEPLLPLAEIEDGGAGWFAIANARDEIASPPTNIVTPYDLALREIEKRIDEDGDEIIEAPGERPEKIRIRPFIADDLCAPGIGGEEFINEVFARAVGLPIETVEWRLWPEDVESGRALMGDADGSDAADLCIRAYKDGGGKQAIGLVSYSAWQAVAQELLTTYHDGYALVRCKTEGVGTIKVGPLRAGHLRIYRSSALSKTEWDGRLDALAKATGRDCRGLRMEDAQHLWEAFDTLKKKVEASASTIVVAQRLRLSSTEGSATSTG